MFCNTAGRTKIYIKKWRLGLKFCVPSVIPKPIEACPTTTLSGQSNLIQRYSRHQIAANLQPLA
jgi:hypothetical protein